MSSKDIRDILEIPVASTSLIAPKKTKSRRPEGITRELYALIGDNAPSLALAQMQATVKPAFKERKLKKVVAPTVTPRTIHWNWTGFTNPSRGAGKVTEGEGLAKSKLKLSHWVKNLPKDHVDGATDNKFSQYNTTSQSYSYSSEEFTAYLREDDWPKEETDHLFELAVQYDLRFIVMADRWEYATKRTVDDLKARYYSVCRKLIRNRPASDETTRNALLQNMNFDKSRELERKSYLQSLLDRSAEQISEEDFLYIESRRLEQTYSKMNKEREDLLLLLGGREGIGASNGGVQVGVGGGRMGIAGGSEKKKRVPGWEEGGAGGLPDGWAGQGSNRKSTPAQDLANCIERHPMPSAATMKALPFPSVSIRSSRLTPPKPTVLLKVQAALVELGINTKLIIPSKNNVEKFDALQVTLGQLMELKKAVDRTEGEMRMLLKRKEGLAEMMEGGVEVKAEEREGDAPKSHKKRSASVASADGNNKRARKD